MKRLWAGIIIVGALLAGASPASAGLDEFITVTGDFAPGGTVTVSGNLCLGTDQLDQPIPGEVNVRIRGGQPPTTVALVVDHLTDLAGNWSVQLTIDAAAQPGEEYAVQASCDWWSVGEPVSFDYPEVVEVMGEAVTPTTDTTSSTETTSSIGAEEAAAEAASTAPRFTG